MNETCLVRKWREISRQVVFTAKRFSILSIDFLRPGNEKYPEVFIKNEPDSVGIFAITKDQQVVMVKHYRAGPGEIVLELPAGDVDNGESPVEAALRELLEETGFQGEKAVITGSTYRDAYSTGIFFSVVVTDCVLERIPVEQQRHKNLRKIILVPLEEFPGILESCTMTNSEAGFRGLYFLK